MKTTTPEAPGGADARERILAAAERLYAQRGVDKTSTREITTEAGVNVASVNYYFRSKDALTEEIFMRLAKRATGLRMADLAACRAQAQATGRPPALEALVDCFLRPYFGPELNGALLARLIIQHRLHPSEMTRRVYEQYMDPFALAFIEALCLTDSRVPRLEWIWRYNLAASTVMLAVTDTERVSVLSNGHADATRGDELRQHLAEFLCRALQGTGRMGA